MKFKELKALPNEELAKKVNDARFELMKLNAQVATGTNPKNPSQIRQLKKMVAHINTLMQQRKGGANGRG
ncbi:MAG: 50S ribosomal protein L29 [archaeon]